MIKSEGGEGEIFIYVLRFKFIFKKYHYQKRIGISLINRNFKKSQVQINKWDYKYKYLYKDIRYLYLKYEILIWATFNEKKISLIIKYLV